MYIPHLKYLVVVMIPATTLLTDRPQTPPVPTTPPGEVYIYQRSLPPLSELGRSGCLSEVFPTVSDPPGPVVFFLGPSQHRIPASSWSLGGWSHHHHHHHYHYITLQEPIDQRQLSILLQISESLIAALPCPARDLYDYSPQPSQPCQARHSTP